MSMSLDIAILLGGKAMAATTHTEIGTLKFVAVEHPNNEWALYVAPKFWSDGKATSDGVKVSEKVAKALMSLGPFTSYWDGKPYRKG